MIIGTRSKVMWVKYLVALSCFIFCYVYFFSYKNLADSKDKKMKLKCFTTTSRETRGFHKLIRSAKHFNLDIEVLGMGKKWKGNAQKIFYYRKALFPYKDTKDVVVLITDGHDVFYNANSSELLTRFLSFDVKVLFSAEKNCWPDESLATKYPLVENGSKYLNAGIYMGYASYIYGILVHNMKVRFNDGSDQLYFTQIFIDSELREKYKIQLDTTSRMFQSLYEVQDDVYIDMSSGKAEVVNKVHSTHPCVIHGNGIVNGPSKNKLFELAAILEKSWNPATATKPQKATRAQTRQKNYSPK